jgi:hypothetical protein
VLGLPVLDPSEISRGGPAEARFEDPETGDAVTLRPADWAAVYAQTVEDVVTGWRLACRRHGISYERVTSDTPFGVALRQALVRSTHLA